MRYLSFLAAVLASAPAYAQSKDTIVLQPGTVIQWLADAPFKEIIVGDDNIIEARPGATNRQLIIIAKPVGTPTNPVRGTTNILLLDANGKEVANVPVTNRGFRYELARSATGWEVYRKN